MHHRATQRDRVEPAAAAAPSGHRAEFVADAREMLAVLIEQLGWKGSGANPRGVGLDETEHAVEHPRTQARAGRGITGGGVGGGDERVGAQIDVEHRALRALEEHARIGLAQLMEAARDIRQQWNDLRAERQLLIERLLEIDRRYAVVVLQYEVVEIQHLAELGGE